jgi:hypothetical protein
VTSERAMPPMRLSKCRRGIRSDPELVRYRVRPIKHHDGFARGGCSSAGFGAALLSYTS